MKKNSRVQQKDARKKKTKKKRMVCKSTKTTV